MMAAQTRNTGAPSVTKSASSSWLPGGGTHRVWRLAADVDTDQLAPGYVMQHGIETIARHCLESVRPDFAGNVQPGDVIVAGPNFGIGSSREQAASVLVKLGVAAVIAPSYSGLYFRNAFNLGLMLLTCPTAEQFQEGETVTLQLGPSPCVMGQDGREHACEPVPGFLVEMVRNGGLFNQLKLRLAQASHG